MRASVKRRVIVTGGGRGIGRSIAAAFTAAGHDVSIIARTESHLVDAVRAGDAARYAVCDVMDSEALRETLEPFANSGIDIVVNNAGGAISQPFLRSDPGSFDHHFAWNVRSAIVSTRALAPGMAERGFGRIINIASTAGLVGYAYVTAYCTAKHALVGFTRSLAVELARRGVTVNAICPGYTETDMLRESLNAIKAKTGRSDADSRAALVAKSPLGRIIDPSEVAAAALWLASDSAGSVTGQAIAIDGGETAA
jgi:NAD(P)-dependent dehydrogenase (short-subunit alcohol dehydrogenase family)